MDNKSIFEHPFYAPLLAAGSIPGGEEIPDDLLQAMAVLIGRSIDGYIDTNQCRGVAALVVLALGAGSFGRHDGVAPPIATKSEANPYTQSNRIGLEVTEGQPDEAELIQS